MIPFIDFLYLSGFKLPPKVEFGIFPESHISVLTPHELRGLKKETAEIANSYWKQRGIIAIR